MKKSLHVIITGNVQGVNFRSYVHKQALELKLAGWVRNNKDGTLEAVFEGEEKNLQKMFLLCKKGPLRARIKNVQEEWWEILQWFTEFKVI
ncbi:acylphosphatase [Candidatus Woesearchaeota archaeon]|nr:acylphosphatase [Candidatus Woesearchaeota archaeon]